MKQPDKVLKDDPILIAAVEVFREQGYASATMQQIAQGAHVTVEAVQTRYYDKTVLFAALLELHNPLPDILSAFDRVLANIQAQGENIEAGEILRDAMRQMVKAVEQHDEFLELAAIDMQVNNGVFVSGLTTQIIPKALELLKRLKATGQLRPVSDGILARTLVSLFMGVVLSERVMPQMARMAMRMFGQRAWIDGMVDLLLYGVLEDDAR